MNIATILKILALVAPLAGVDKEKIRIVIAILEILAAEEETK